ncbi:gliding motility-associated C-terminal domain-containing protein, partial [Flavobacterium sp. ZB4P13]|uniref:gliding motility-associated C-terminal domain-containing protein n=1 Tax=Flavobacterium sp. ZB4P13 TaxID=3401728 RepID=UPI003AAA67D3
LFVAGSCANTGTYTNTWVANDVCSNTSATFTQVITIEDTTAPVITTCANNKTIASNSSCTALVPDFTADIAASDNCTLTSSLIITQVPTVGTVVGSGSTSVTISVKDACGNENTCLVNLIVTNFIVANDDSGTPINSFTGGTALIDVLANDKLNCNTVNLADVILRFVSSTNTGITLSGSDVIVASGTPTGMYTLVYSICEKLNPSNCDTASVSFTVTAPVIDAKEESTVTINGNAGGTTPSLTDNDKLNGNPVVIGTNPGEVTLTGVTVPTGLTLNPDGTVTVLPNTPAGSYGVAYKICEVTNPTNCATVLSKVVVEKAAIDAITETTDPINGNTGGTTPSLTDNDKLNGNTVVIGTNPGEVALTGVTVPAGLTLNTNGTVTVAPNTPAGSYDVAYKICEVTNPTNCAMVFSKIVVNAATIQAIDDAMTGGNGTTGTPNAGNVLDGNPTSPDTLNGTAVVIGLVNLTITTPATPATAGAPVPSIDVASGIVTVPANTPAGTYIIVYNLCEKLNPTNCDSATVTVNVVDTTPPVMTDAANLAVQCDDNGNNEALQAWLDSHGGATATDTSSEVTWSNNYNGLSDGCGGTGSATVVFTVTDNSGNASISTATFAIEDTTLPTFNESAPANTIASCDTIPVAAVLTATDNCGTATVTMTQTILAGNCPSNYTIVRTWIATDTCGNNSAPITQNIVVSDVNGPTLVTELESNVQVVCNEIPAVPTLQFTDNCSAVGTPVFTETQSALVNGIYDITRTWTVSDACGNRSTFIQVLHVTQVIEVTEVPKSSCTTVDLSYDLRSLLPNPDDVPTDAIWTNVDSAIGFTGTSFNAFGNQAGVYTFSYTIKTGACPRRIEIKMTVDTNCEVLSCESIVIHNAFTPNGDGFNQFFNIENIDNIECYPTNKVEIYNRWGVLVYETNNYDNSSRRFEGISEGRVTINKSKELPTGTYYYIIQYTTTYKQTVNKAGYLYLSR